MLPERLRKARDRAGLTQDELGDLLGYDRSAVSTWESGTRTAPSSVVRKVADALHTSVGYLSGETDNPRRPLPDEVPIGKTRQIPIISHIIIGSPVVADERTIGWEEVLETDMEEGATYFFLRVKGNTMEPKIGAGSLTLVREQPMVEDGQIAAVVFMGKEEVEFYRVYADGKRSIFKADNPNYPPIVAAKNAAHIAGRVIEVRSKL